MAFLAVEIKKKKQTNTQSLTRIRLSRKNNAEINNQVLKALLNWLLLGLLEDWWLLKQGQISVYSVFQ